MPFQRCVPDPADGGAFDGWRLESEGVAATVVPAAGMNLVSFEVAGVDRLALPMPLPDFLATLKTGGVPLLHPWANRLRGDRWSFDGVEVDLAAIDDLKRDSGGLPMHGLLLRESGWSVSSVGDDAIEGRLDWSDAHPRFAAFPFAHRVAVRWAVRSGGTNAASATCRFVVEAGDRPLPLATGWHPYLRPTPGAEAASISIETPSMRRVPLDDRGLPVLDADGRPALEPAANPSGPIGTRRFDDLYLVGESEGVGDDGWTAAVAADGSRVELVADASWRWMQVFTPAGSDAVCLEPMLAPTSSLVDGGAVRLDAGETFEASFTIRVVLGGDA